MAQEMSLQELGSRMTALAFDPMSRTLDLTIASLQLNARVLQAAIESMTASLEAGRKFLETLQRSSASAMDAWTELGTASMRAWAKLVEGVQPTWRATVR